MLLSLSIVANVGVLVIFKYYNFLASNFNIALIHSNANFTLPLLTILLPIGLSFHTFQAMSYTIEVYRGNQQPEKHFGIYALYVMFYPQLVAGPIERPQNIIHQFYEKKYFNYENVRAGLILMAWGFFKKVVIADRLALFVNTVYSHPHNYNGISLIIATVFFSFQIFCDFSGYSDIAIGCARVMGYDLMKNFNRPYLSASMSEFWTRWHISLSTWFRDYVYIPLGGSRVSRLRFYFNLFIVFLISGLWHGANWTFIIWGALNGCLLVLENILLSEKVIVFSPKAYHKIMRRCFVFILATLAWIFFRANNLSDAWYVLTHLALGISQQLILIKSNAHLARGHILYLEQDMIEFIYAIFFVLVMIFIHYAQGNNTFLEWIESKSKPGRWFMYYFFIASFILFGVFNKSSFIYFQF